MRWPRPSWPRAAARSAWPAMSPAMPPAQALVDAALAAFGKINVLVNNAGGGGPKPFDMPMETFVWAYELNVFSVFHLTQLCAPHIAKGRRRRGAEHQLDGRREQEPAHGVLRVVEGGREPPDAQHRLRPGAHGHPRQRHRAGRHQDRGAASVLTPEIEKAMLKHTPLGRLGEARDIAHAALFLCSPASSWVSGQVLTVSGGGVQELD